MDQELFVEVFKQDMRNTFVPICIFLLILASIIAVPFIAGFGGGIQIAIALYVAAVVFSLIWTVVGAFGSYREEKILQK